MKVKLKKMKTKTIGTTKMMLRDLIRKMRGATPRKAAQAHVSHPHPKGQEVIRFPRMQWGTACNQRRPPATSTATIKYQTDLVLPQMNEFRTWELNFMQKIAGSCRDNKKWYKWIDEVDNVDDCRTYRRWCLPDDIIKDPARSREDMLRRITKSH